MPRSTIGRKMVQERPSAWWQRLGKVAAMLVLAPSATGWAADPEFETLSLVMLKRGPAWSAEESAEASARQAAHMAHLKRMWTEGKAEVCGPVAGDAADQDLRGICLYRADRPTALELASADPAVQSGHLTIEVHDWYFGPGHLAFPMRSHGPAHREGGHGEGPHGKGAHGKGAHGDGATVHHRFDDPERWAQVFDDPARDAWQLPAVLVAGLDIPKRATVADIGAGTGYFNPYLADAVGRRGHVIAVDVERNLVDWMTVRAERDNTPQVHPRLGRFEDPALLRKEADLILMVDTYHHIDDRRAYFGRLRASVAEGGRLAIVDFKPGELPVGPPPEHRIAAEQVVDELTAAGWRLVDSPDLLPHQFIRVFALADEPAGD